MIQGTQIFGALGLVVNDKQQFIITKRNDPEVSDIHDKWEIPGGGIEFGEDPVVALKREMIEETGLIVEPMVLLPFVGSVVRRHQDESHHVILVCYICKALDATIPIVLNEEATAYQWVTSADLASLDHLTFVDTYIELAEAHIRQKT